MSRKIIIYNGTKFEFVERYLTRTENDEFLHPSAGIKFEIR